MDQGVEDNENASLNAPEGTNELSPADQAALQAALAAAAQAQAEQAAQAAGQTEGQVVLPEQLPQ